MKKILFIAGFMVVGLFLEVGVSSAADGWKPTGPLPKTFEQLLKSKT